MPERELPALRQEMTITRAEFLRCLPAAVDSVAFTVAGSDIRYGNSDKGWRIVLAPLPDLAIGIVRLTRHRVEIWLTGYDAPATRRFLDRFELYFRRAGG